jgi:ubiquinone/menaquinone biosynthesis C-methylase UbiE
MNISNKFNIKNWNESYDRGENNILYPQPEVVKFLNRFIRKKVDYSGRFINILNKNSNNERKIIALDFGCGVARHAILMDEFGIEAYGLDVSDSAIKKARENCKSFGLEKLINRLNVIKDHKILFEDNFFDFSIAESSLDSMTFENAKIYFKEISRVTKKYIHLTLISSETTQVADFAGDITVKSNHEKGTIQSYYNLEKINSLLNEVNCKIIFNRKINEISQIDNFVHTRFHLVIELK